MGLQLHCALPLHLFGVILEVDALLQPCTRGKALLRALRRAGRYSGGGGGSGGMLSGRLSAHLCHECRSVMQRV